MGVEVKVLTMAGKSCVVARVGLVSRAVCHSEGEAKETMEGGMEEAVEVRRAAARKAGLYKPRLAWIAE